MQKVLIVGAGLSGICLSHHFKERNVNLTLIDNGINHSTVVAAAMINPLVFRRMTKSWRVDDFLPYAKSYYEQLAAEWKQQVYYPLVIRRFFSSVQERNFWIERQSNPAFSEYVIPMTEEDESIHPFANEFGSGRVNNAAHIDAELYLHASIEQLKTTLRYQQSPFDYAQLNAETGSYQGEEFDLILFAEGYLGVDNPWFKDLPLTQTKGETLTIQLSELSTAESLNRKCFLLPLKDSIYKIGSNYSWDDPSTHITEEAKHLILDNFGYLTDERPVVLEQKAGVRPTTLDRRPFIGKHPHFERLAIFNGLGAKGFLIAPLLAKEFVDALMDGKEIDAECRINHRFKSTI